MNSIKKKIIIVSLYGMDKAGGVERVIYYIYNILCLDYDVKVLTKINISFGIFDVVLQSVIASLRLYFMKKNFVICNSKQAFLFPADILIYHGVLLGYVRKHNTNIGFIGKLNIFIDKFSGKIAKQIIVVGLYAKKELIELYNFQNRDIKIINNFVNETIFFPHNLRNKNSNHITILYSGRLEHMKGLQYLVSLSDYIEKMSNFKLIMAIANETNSELFINKYNTEILVGLTIGDMVEFYNSGDVLFFPTLYEGFPMATLEALSCGIPVVGSNFAIPEELQNYAFCREITQNLSDPGFVLKIVNDIVTEYHDKRIYIHNIIRKDFGKEQYNDKFLKVIYKVC